MVSWYQRPAGPAGPNLGQHLKRLEILVMLQEGWMGLVGYGFVFLLVGLACL